MTDDDGRTGMDSRYFFAGGMQFECTQCGRCCTGGPGAVRVSADETSALAGLRGMAREDFIAAFVRRIEGIGECLTEREDGSCIFFEAGRCSVYGARPAQCRTYPFWLKNLRSEEAWLRVCRECPGIGRGPRHLLDEILGKVAASPV